MRIGIIGAGFIAQAVAAHVMRFGHHVMISNSRGPATLGSTVAALGCQARTADQAAEFGDTVLVAIPLHAYRSIPPGPLAGKIVLDANNYYPDRDGVIAELDSGVTTTSEMLAKHVSQARVVKAFNAILQRDLAAGGTPPGAAGRRALPIAGDEMAAKRIASGLIDQCGFDTVDAGPLSEGWRFERAMPAYCIPFDRDGLASALAAAKRGKELPHGSWRTRAAPTDLPGYGAAYPLAADTSHGVDGPPSCLVTTLRGDERCPHCSS